MTSNILVVCTGNICRSPMAAALLRVGAGVVGLDVRVASGGSWEGGVGADPHAIAVMADRGIDLGSHRSHVVTDADIDAADLIVAMAREHVVDIAARSPEAFNKTLTIKELAQGASEAGPRPEGAAVVDYIASLSAGRTHAQILRSDSSIDVEDPLGQGRRAFEKTAAELETLVWMIVDLLAGYPPRT